MQADGSINVNESITTSAGDIILEVDANNDGAETLTIAAGKTITEVGGAGNEELRGNGTIDTLAGVSTVAVIGADAGTADGYDFTRVC